MSDPCAPLSICLHTHQLLHGFPVHSNTNTKSSLSWAPSAYVASSPALLHPGSGSEVSLFLKNAMYTPISALCFGCSLCLKPSSPKYLLSPSAPSCCPLLQYNLQYNLPWLLYSSAHLLPQTQFCCSSLPRDILSVCPLLKVSRDFLLCPQYLGRGQHIAGWQ